MPIERKTLTELDRRIQAELPLAGAGVVLRRNLYTPLARSLAGAVHGLNGYLQWQTLQMFPQTCDDDVLEYLHAPIWLPNNGRKAATVAQGKIRISGTAGRVIPQGTVLNRDDNIGFIVLNGVTLSATGSIEANVACNKPGLIGNTEPGRELILANPIAGVESRVLVSGAGIIGGNDIETITELRARVVVARLSGRTVGRSSDWESWAKEVAGVTRAWAAPKLNGIGTMTVYFVRDNDPDIYPDSIECKKVLDHLETTGTPFGEIYAVAPKKKTLDFNIHLVPDTAEIRSAVTSALRHLINRHASPVKRDERGRTAVPVSGITLPRSHINEAISNAPGEYDHKLLAPAGDINSAVGDLIELGTITWT